MARRINSIGRVAPATAYTSGTDALVLAPATGYGPRIINITVAVSVATTAIVRIAGVDLTLNSGDNLVAGALYTFSMQYDESEVTSIRFGANCTIRKLAVSEEA